MPGFMIKYLTNMRWAKGILVTLIAIWGIISIDQDVKGIDMRSKNLKSQEAMVLFLCGDVMTGRGIDQVLPYSVDPRLYEPYVKDAGQYVQLAERANGPIDQPVSYSYIWEEALEVWEHQDPDFKLINLETGITTHHDPWPGKGIHYRMHPKNIDLLTTAGIDFCSLANNHIMDWGKEGLLETLEKLKAADILQAGAGKNRDEAQNPAVLQSPKGRVIIMAFGSTSSGIPGRWAAGKEQPGVNMLPNAGKSSFSKIKRQIAAIRQPGDIVIFSVHWGDNWGYQVPDDQRKFAHLLIDRAGVDLIYGHSSHPPRGIEVYRNKLILYGTGDFLNDYEGISGHEQYRGDLTLMYFPRIDPADGTLHSLKLIPMQIKNFQLNPVNQGDREWLLQVLNEKVTLEGTSVRLNQDGSFYLHWP